MLLAPAPHSASFAVFACGGWGKAPGRCDNGRGVAKPGAGVAGVVCPAPDACMSCFLVWGCSAVTKHTFAQKWGPHSRKSYFWAIKTTFLLYFVWCNDVLCNRGWGRFWCNEVFGNRGWGYFGAPRCCAIGAWGSGRAAAKFASTHLPPSAVQVCRGWSREGEGLSGEAAHRFRVVAGALRVCVQVSVGPWKY